MHVQHMIYIYTTTKGGVVFHNISLFNPGNLKNRGLGESITCINKNVTFLDYAFRNIMMIIIIRIIIK